MKLVARCDHAVQAAHVVNVLRAAGIRAEVRNTSLAGALGEIPWSECAPQVWVLDDLEHARARQIVDDLRRPPPTGAPWTCARCGEWSEVQFGECWRCGQLRPD
jgi:hypothetical protein